MNISQPGNFSPGYRSGYGQSNSSSPISPMSPLGMGKNFSLSSRNVSSLLPPPPYKPTHSDDILIKDWLEEINLPQYTETFTANLSSDGLIIRRRRLVNIRQQDLSKMNITDFAHQKLLMQHITLSLKYPFNSAVRRKEVKNYAPIQAAQQTDGEDHEVNMQHDNKPANGNKVNFITSTSISTTTTSAVISTSGLVDHKKKNVVMSN